MKIDRKNMLETVAKNVNACLESGRGPSSQIQLGKKIRAGQSTMGRVLTGKNDTRIGTLHKIAAAYGLETWQLLVDGLDPKNPPVLRSVSPAEDALYERLREAVDTYASVKRG